MDRDWAALSGELEQLLKLRSIPFAMKLFEDRAAMEAIPRIRRPQHVHTLDQLVGQASRLGWTVGVTSDDLVGAQCRAVVGLGGAKTDEWKSGKHMTGVWFENRMLFGRTSGILLLLLIVVQAAGGPGSMLGLDYARTFNPTTRFGAANGMVNTGGFIATLICIGMVGVLLDASSGGAPQTIGDFEAPLEAVAGTSVTVRAAADRPVAKRQLLIEGDAVPEASTFWLGAGGLGLFWVRRRLANPVKGILRMGM